MEPFDTKTMKRDEPDEVIVPGSPEQYLPSAGELALEPSYNVTLSQLPQLPHDSIDNSWNVTAITYNNAADSRTSTRQ